MQQAVLDDWFLRQDILDQLMRQEEEASEAERYADRIIRIAQEDSAEHQVLTDPFDRSVALVLSLVKEEGMDPWNIDLSAFEKVHYLPFQPTSENLVLDFVKKIKEKLPSHVELYKVVLSETATSFAEWSLEDN